MPQYCIREIKVEGVMKHKGVLIILIGYLLIIFGCNNGDSGIPAKDVIPLFSITPTNSCNLGVVNILSITGLKFSDGVTVKLTKSGEDDIVATSVLLTGDSEISCEFDLTGASVGAWDLMVSDGVLDPGILDNGFTVTNARYVSTTGDDLNTGTASSPLLTIQKAILASSAGQEVRVSSGTYSVDSSSQIVLKNGVSVRGGFNPVTWNQDIETNTTTVQDTSSTTTGSNDAPHCVFRAAGAVQSGTLLEGFTINGATESGVDYTSGIFLDQVSGAAYGPTIRYNTIDGGSGSGASYGIYARGHFNVVIEYNSINGGSCPNFSYGFYGRMLDSTLIQSNFIHGGSASSSYGIYFRQGSDPYISNNLIYGGEGSHTFAIGVMNNLGNTVVIRNNTIDGGLGNSNYSYGIHIRNSDPVIQNNIIFSTGNTNQYGIFEYDAVSDPLSVDNNDIFDCTDALYYDEGTNNITTISGVNGLAEASSNISIDPLFTDPASEDYHVNASGMKAGLNGTDESWVNFPENASGNPIDKESTERPGTGNPWTIGAYE
jgi:hypothetical protein